MMKWKNENIIQLFYIPPRHRTAIIVWMFLVAAVYGFRIFVFNNPAFSEEERRAILAKLLVEDSTLNNFLAAYDEKSAAVKRTLPDSETVFQNFDPNRIDSVGLVSLGLSLRVVRNILRYRDKGGRFYNPGDLKKIYGLSPEEFHRIEPFVVIRPASSKLFDSGLNMLIPEARPDRGIKTDTDKAVVVFYDINRLDSAELWNLPGIGEVLAGRIVRYRQLLGGFASLDQLREIYGMQEMYLQKLLPHLQIGSEYKKLDWMNLEFRQLLRHPYADYEQTRLLKSYRGDNPGNFVDSLYRNGLISDKLLLYLASY